jgi:type I restriction enzyme S subunit
MSKRNAWRQTTLGEALPIRYGKARTDKAGIVREDSPVYGSSGVIGKFDRALTTGPTLIIGRKGTVGATHYSGEACWPIDTVYFAEGSEGKNLRFFKYLLDHLQLSRLDRSTAVPGLSRDDYNAKEVAIPHADEQQRIVAEIEKQFTRLDAGVSSLKRVQIALKRYRASVLKAACEGRLVPTEAELARKETRSYETGEQLLQWTLKARREKWNGKGKYEEPTAANMNELPPVPEGWEWATLDAIAEIKGGITKDQKRKFTVPTRLLPYLRVANVQRGYLDLSEIKNIEATEDVIRELALEPGDILFNEGGDRDKLGRGWVWSGELPECIHQNHVFRARLLGSALNPKFISWYANSFGQQFFFAEGKHTTNLASISMTKLKRLPVPIPPTAEQRRIVDEVERTFSVIEELETAEIADLQRATRLRAAVLQHAFGERHTAT